ncbi:MAG: LPS export ABC transporter ATP-binding protein [Proteobacteria bacterium]|jgi:lipopolysaccharide export system ATP-binding protein|nr:MAG: LPS export ABC transporter ATP-binding protein [Pseudomonadota bacterium]
MKHLRCENLKKSFKTHLAVRGVSFEVPQGKVVGLLGPNGAGKTTSFYMAVGLLSPDEGTVKIDDQDITRMSMHERARAGLGYLPQEASVFRRLTVEQNIYAVLEAQEHPASFCENRTAELIEEFNLQRVRKTYGSLLSGGERRRVEIARALALNPDFLLLDEPFAGIDPIAVGDIQKLISALRDKGMGVLITDHNVRETLKICDMAYILITGLIEEKGLPSEIAKSEKARASYLGQDFRL